MISKKENMKKIFNELTDKNKDMIILIAMSIKIAQDEDSRNEGKVIGTADAAAKAAG